MRVATIPFPVQPAVTPSPAFSVVWSQTPAGETDADLQELLKMKWEVYLIVSEVSIFQCEVL